MKINNYHHTFILLLSFTLAVQVSFAQISYNGRVTDLIGGKPIAGATVVSSLGKGTTTGENGIYSIELESYEDSLFFSHLSYKPIVLAIEISNQHLPDVQMVQNLIGLKEVSIISSVARERETPIAISTIKTAVIEREMGSQAYPEIMKMTPGIYATKLGGGNGDARISIRGFQQENIGLLLNGVPVSSVENGLVYWSNWAGLGDATQTIQVQRGLGASRTALNSVGGTVNIITKTTSVNKGGSLRYDVSSFGNQKTTLSLSTGKMAKGYSIVFLGSRTTGPGYVDATYVDAWSWFLTISRQINPNHLLVFTGLGSPERHGQQNYGLSSEQVDKYGPKYNPNWGMYNGEINSLSENFYHKPQLSLNHYWNFGQAGLLSTSAYVSFGKGGGKFSESFQSAPASSFRKNNQIDWDAIFQQNVTNTDSVRISSGEYVHGFSKIIQSDYLASHVWYGLLSTLNQKVNDRFNVITGFHARYFKSNLHEEISDLLGGNFWVDEYAWTIPGIAGRQQIKTLGEIINVDTDSRVDVVSYFGQLEYNHNNLSAFVAGTLANTWFQRADRMNYIENTKSEMVTKSGFDVKAGANYNLGQHHNIYLNAGYYSRAPYFKFVFANFTNEVVQNLTNEKIQAVEAGYGFSDNRISFNVNAYYTLWKDKSLLSKENIQLENQGQTRALVRGLDALHKGIEIEGALRIAPEFLLGALLSAGDWKWQNDVEASLYNDNQQLVDQTTLYVKGLKVGDAPQFQLGFYGQLKLLKELNVKANWLYFSKLYADFNPATRSNPEDRQQSFRIPDYSLLDLHLNYGFPIASLSAEAAISCFNVMNKLTITRGEDGIDHNRDSFRGFWSQGRTFNLSVKVMF